MASISIGAPLGTYLVHSGGRKYTILLTAIPSVFGFILYAFAPDVYYLYMARFFGGLSEGIGNIALPAYVGEVAHPLIRGKLGCITSLLTIAGMLGVNIIGSILPIMETAIICSIFPVLLVGTFSWLPESPYYLLIKNKHRQAKRALRILRGTKNVDVELKQIEVAVEKQTLNAGSWFDLFCIKSNRRALIIALSLDLIQQATGISAIQSYTQVIFIESKQNISYQLSAIIIMFTQGCVGLLGSPLVDRWGRKPLLTLSCIGCGFCLIMEGFYFYLQSIDSSYLPYVLWLPLTALVLFIAVYSVGLAIVINVLFSEIFSANVKGKALGVITVCYGIIAFIVSRFFQVLINWAGLHLPFWMYALNCIVGAAYVMYYVPETKGKTLDEIQDYFKTY